MPGSRYCQGPEPGDDRPRGAVERSAGPLDRQAARATPRAWLGARRRLAATGDAVIYDAATEDVQPRYAAGFTEVATPGMLDQVDALRYEMARALLSQELTGWTPTLSAAMGTVTPSGHDR